MIKLQAIGIPATIEQCQVALDCAYAAGKAHGKFEAEEQILGNGYKARSDAWCEVYILLSTLDPEFHSGGGTGLECALRSINRLAAKK